MRLLQKIGAIIHRPFRYTFVNATLVLCAVNAALFFAAPLIPRLKDYLSLNLVYFVYFRFYWQVFTYMFMHGSISHLLMNLLALFCFGFSVERTLGSKEFVLLYLLSGVFCGAVSLVLYWFLAINGNQFVPYVQLVGASGAIYAVLFAYAVLFPRNNIYIFGIVPVPAPILVIAYAALEFFSQVLGRGGNVAHYAHLAGFAFAWLYFVVRMRINPWKVWFRR